MSVCLCVCLCAPSQNTRGFGPPPLKKIKKITQPLQICIGPTIRIYAGFFIANMLLHICTVHQQTVLRSHLENSFLELFVALHSFISFYTYLLFTRGLS